MKVVVEDYRVVAVIDSSSPSLLLVARERHRPRGV